MNPNEPLYEPLLSVKNLSISFGGLKAVSDLSFDIHKKDIFGLIGPNGAGKTTVFNCITQFYKANEGEVLYQSPTGEINLMDLHVSEIIGQGIVRTFQNVEVVKELSILENVMLGANYEFKTNLWQQVFQTGKASREERVQIDKAIEVLKHIGIEHLKEMPAGSQAYGIQKKVELARALMANPKLIILDEPAAGLNDRETEELSEIIMGIRDNFQCTVLLVEHDMRLVMKICDRICAISFGKKLAVGTPAEIQQNKEVQEAYLGVE